MNLFPLTCLLLSTSLAASIDFPNVVNFDITGFRTNVHPIGRYNTLELRQPKLRPRTATNDVIESTLINTFSYYQIKIQIGTPPQDFQPVVDTGSSDLWVVASDNPICNEIPCNEGLFDYKSSSTFHVNNSDFFTQYADGTVAEGMWGTDVVQIENAVIKDCSLGVATGGNTSASGILGIGFPTIESTATPIGNTQPYIYPNVPQLLRTQHDIDPVAYSLWLNDLNAGSGQLLFGGIDHAKYEPPLITVPLIKTVPGLNQPGEMAVVLSGLSVTDVNGKSSQLMNDAVAVILDSGTTVSFLPENVVLGLYQAFDAQIIQQGSGFAPQLAAVRCAVGNSQGAFTFDFSGAQITVPFNEILLPLADDNGNAATFDDGEPACAIGLLPVQEEPFILGDTLLRSAYVVYNLDNFEISLANTKYNISSSDIEGIGSNGVPSATKAPNYSSTQLAQTISALSFSGDFTALNAGPGTTSSTRGTSTVSSTSAKSTANTSSRSESRTSEEGLSVSLSRLGTTSEVTSAGTSAASETSSEASETSSTASETSLADFTTTSAATTTTESGNTNNGNSEVPFKSVSACIALFVTIFTSLIL